MTGVLYGNRIEFVVRSMNLTIFNMYSLATVKTLSTDVRVGDFLGNTKAVFGILFRTEV